MIKNRFWWQNTKNRGFRKKTLCVLLLFLTSLCYADDLFTKQETPADETDTKREDTARLIEQKYQVQWTNLNTEGFADINYLLADSSTVDQRLADLQEQKPWQINEPIIIEFANPVLQGDLQSIHVVAIDQTALKYADTDGLLELGIAEKNQGVDWQYQQILRISPHLFYRSYSNGNDIQRDVVNLPLDTTYSVYVKAYVQNTVQEFRLFTFKTPAIGVFVERETSQVELDENWQSSLTLTERKNLEISQAQHRRESAQEIFRSFSGKGVTIAVQDDGIRQDSYANSRVRFKLQDIPDSLLGTPPNQGAAHGTLMANFLIDYAPSVELLDFNIFPYVQHIIKRVGEKFTQQELKYHDYAGLAYRLGADLMNVSLISPRLQNRSNMWFNAITSGLVISKSLGNDNRITHYINEANCSDPTHFIPYFADYYDVDLQNSEGALVTLQAALKTKNGYISARSRAGDAAPYTLTVLETQRGATSQAAATFSGMFALIKEAANRYNRNYSNKQLVEILFETVDDIGEEGIDPIYGYGLVNVDRALKEIERGYAPSVNLYSNLRTDIDDQILEKIYQQGCRI